MENPKIKRLNRYKRLVLFKRRKLTRDDILLAMQYSRSNMAAARYLGVHYTTYYKYAKSFMTDDGTMTLFDKHLNPGGKGLIKYHYKADKAVNIQEILNGQHPGYNPVNLKNRLIQDGILPEECAKCGYKERRIFDGKIPLILNFLDNDIANFKLANLELLCYNCYFNLVGNPVNPFKIYSYARLVDYDKKDLDPLARKIAES